MKDEPAGEGPGDREPADDPGARYDAIGGGYATGRRTDPRIAARIHAALGDAETVVNVGAGTGSYEPVDRDVVAVEPSAVMRRQRPAGSPPCVAAAAEALPFADRTFDVAMAVLSDHHWRDPVAGLREMRRVARRVVVFQWDDATFPAFWLVRDHLPEMPGLAAGRPSFAQREAVLGARPEPVPIPWDCVDGFFHCHWRRPEAYLDEAVRRATSVWARLGPQVERRAVTSLARQIETGAWAVRNAALVDVDEADVGARLLVA